MSDFSDMLKAAFSEGPQVLPGYNLAQRPIKPSNKELKQLLMDYLDLKHKVETVFSLCEHTPRFTSYKESDQGTGYTVGFFDIATVCTKCGTKDVIKHTPPLCKCCKKPLRLEIFNGEIKSRFGKKKLQVWREEHAKRYKKFNKDPLAVGMFYTQFGVYVCTDKICKAFDKPKFYITGGD